MPANEHSSHTSSVPPVYNNRARLAARAFALAEPQYTGPDALLHPNDVIAWGLELPGRAVQRSLYRIGYKVERVTPEEREAVLAGELEEDEP
jgi:hypothetical protein